MRPSFPASAFAGVPACGGGGSGGEPRTMKIVIAGAGEMGSHLARMLSGNGHDITIIDADQKLLAEVGSLADVLTVEGDSTTFAVLRRAAVRRCDLFHRRQSRGDGQYRGGDAGQAARGEEKSIARIDNNEYLEPDNKGAVHRHGHRLPVLSREGRGARGDQPAGPYLDHRVRRFLERQTLAGCLPPRTGFAARGRGAVGGSARGRRR